MLIFSTGWSEGYDGPGRRLVVYLKGCNFRCRWCGNPEGVSPDPEMLFYAGRTRHAESACPHGAVRGAALARDACRRCSDTACVAVAKDPAFELAGGPLTAGQLRDRAAAARALFGRSGGVTFSGGEPTLQAEELLDALDELRRAGLHTAVETNASTEAFPLIAGRADLIIADVKCQDPERHRQWTGGDNSRVASNLRAAAESASALLVRTTLVTGVNDSEEEMDRLAGLLAGLARPGKELQAQVLRLHHLGEPKYAALGLEYPMKNTPPPAPETVRRLEQKLEAAGVRLAGWA